MVTQEILHSTGMFTFGGIEGNEEVLNYIKISIFTDLKRKGSFTYVKHSKIRKSTYKIKGNMLNICFNTKF